MPDLDKVYFMNGGKYTKLQMVLKGLEQCMMSSDKEEYETQCHDCPYFDPDVTVEKCMEPLKEDAIALLKEQNTVVYALSVLKKADEEGRK